MARFDEWVTDRAITRVAVEDFIADPTRVGQSFLGRYFVCATSGTTGEPGIFVHDPAAMVVYRSFSMRADLMWLTAGDWLSLARRGFRWAAVVGTGGRFGGEAWMEHQRLRSAWCRHTYRVFSVQQPLPALVHALDEFNPAIVTYYPSAAAMLAGQQRAGRLHLRPTCSTPVGGLRHLPFVCFSTRRGVGRCTTCTRRPSSTLSPSSAGRAGFT
jgi:hypothetical protein